MAEEKTEKSKKKGKGMSIGARLVATFLGFIVALGAGLIIIYQSYVPAIVNHQINLRAESVATSFASAVLEPMVVKNYLRVNKIAEVSAKLPDVAYAAVFNKKGFPVAGIFGDLDQFTPDFRANVKETGFPKIVDQENIPAPGQKFGRKHITLGGQDIIDVVIPLAQTGSKIHLGLFTKGVQRELNKTLEPLIILILLMAIAGAALIFFVSRGVSRPIRQLTDKVQALSTGKPDQKIDMSDIKAKGELAELAESFERMQKSIQYAIKMADRRKK